MKPPKSNGRLEVAPMNAAAQEKAEPKLILTPADASALATAIARAEKAEARVADLELQVKTLLNPPKEKLTLIGPNQWAYIKVTE